MPTTHFIVHDKTDNVGVIVVEDVKAGQTLTGWVIEGDGRVSHSGSWMGTATYVLRDHPSGISVVVLSNDESADVAGIAEALSELTE